jgi:hypothetical protein
MKHLMQLLALSAALLGGALIFGLALAAADLVPSVGPEPTPTSLPSPTPWLLSITPGELQMPAGSDCKACHETNGGVIGIKDIPAIPHPISWGTCTACHDNARLVQTAPGHSGIHASQCLVCHTVSLGPAPPPSHAALPNFDCLSCHGVTAPLPADMAHRPGEECWLCHLSPSPAPSP